MENTYPTADQKKLSQLDPKMDVFKFSEISSPSESASCKLDQAKIETELSAKQIQAWVTAPAGFIPPQYKQMTGAYITDHCGTIIAEKTGLSGELLTEDDLCAVFVTLIDSIKKSNYVVRLNRRMAVEEQGDVTALEQGDGQAITAVSAEGVSLDLIDDNPASRTYELKTSDWHAFAAISYCFGTLIDLLDKESLTPSDVERKLRLLSLEEKDFVIRVNEKAEYQMVSVSIASD